MPSKILVVDDNEDILDLLELFLHQDFSVSTAQNGFMALKIALEVKPNLIITDLMMPIMNGEKLIAQIRSYPEIQKLPVIAITAHIDRFREKEIIEIGFNSFIKKPFTRKTIYEEIRRLI